MNIKIKIYCDESKIEELFDKFKEEVKFIKKIKGGIIIDPLIINDIKYIIPNDVKLFEHILLIDISEYGGLNPKNNLEISRLICGMTGKKLKAYFIPNKNVKPNGNHAYFSIPGSCYTINIKNEILTINRLNIIDDEEENIAILDSEIIYNGKPNEIPSNFNKFKEVIDLALKKSKVENCCESFYIEQSKVFKNGN